MFRLFRSHAFGEIDGAPTYFVAHELAAYSVLYVLLEDPLILSKPASRLIFGFSLLLGASAGLGALSAHWNAIDDDANFPAMRAPVQPPIRVQHRDMTPPPAAPSSGESTKAIRET
jgi:hypothetical protein